MTIAVLPFNNMSEDPEQEYFSDGISEDIITDLSQISSLGVISRTSSFVFRDRTVNVQEIGSALSADYLLQGSIRRLNDRVRINAELTAVTTGQSVWASRYDRPLDNIFEVQDEIRNKIVSALSIQLLGREATQLERRQTDSFKAYDLFLQGRRLYNQFTLETFVRAESLYLQAIELDPEFARAYGALAMARVRRNQIEEDIDRAAVLDESLVLAQRAVEIEPTSPQTQWVLGFIYMAKGEFARAAEVVERSVALSPNFADGYGLLALINNQMGRGDQALRFIRKGMRLNPGYSWDYPYNEGRAFYLMGEYDKAIASLLLALERNENAWNPRLYLAASYARLGRLEEAEWEITQLQMNSPGLTISSTNNVLPMAEGAHRAQFLQDLRAAGLPE